MTGGKKSAFAGQGKGWRKGVKGIGVKKKHSDGDSVKLKKRREKPPLIGGDEEQKGGQLEPVNADGDYAHLEAKLRDPVEAGKSNEGEGRLLNC
jgi:hypothetical protein